MGNSCSCVTNGAVVVEPPRHAHDGFHGENTAEEQNALHYCPDPLIYDLVRRDNPNFPPPIGQHQLLYKKGKPPVDLTQPGVNTNAEKGKHQSTRLVVRNKESSHSHIYAIRSTESSEQRPPEPQQVLPKPEGDLSVDPYLPQNMRVQPQGHGTHQHFDVGNFGNAIFSLCSPALFHLLFSIFSQGLGLRFGGIRCLYL